MANLPAPGYQTCLKNKLYPWKSVYQALVQRYPEADAQIKQLIKVLGDIEEVARHIRTSVRENAELGCHCKCCGRKRSVLLQWSPWKGTFWCGVRHSSSNVTRVKGRAQGKETSKPNQLTKNNTATNNAGGWFDGFQKVRRRKRYALKKPPEFERKPQCRSERLLP